MTIYITELITGLLVIAGLLFGEGKSWLEFKLVALKFVGAQDSSDVFYFSA